jgi:hypothetical protein
MLNYSIKDFIYELNHFLNYRKDLFPAEGGILDIEAFQRPERTIDPDFLKGEDLWKEEYHFFHSLLDLDQMYRFDGVSPYKFHRSYPSPRSLYPLKLLIRPAGSKKLYCKNQFTEEIEEYTFSTNSYNCHEVIIIYNSKVYPEFYINIKKSLLILELGHLLYNIHMLIEPYSSKVSLKIMDQYVSLGIYDEEENLKRFRLDDDFHSILLKRTSGTFRNGLTPLLRYNDHQLIYDQFIEYLKICTEAASDFFKLDVKDVIGLYIMSNSNGIYFDLYNYFEREKIASKVRYMELNRMYPYIHFRGVNFLITFSIKHKALLENEISRIILLIGFICQASALFFTNKDMFSRPLKSFSMELMEKQLNLNSGAESLHYLLAAGYSRD